MDSPTPSEITRMLSAWREGDAEALSRLTPLVYGELTDWPKPTWQGNGLDTFRNPAPW